MSHPMKVKHPDKSHKALHHFHKAEGSFKGGTDKGPVSPKKKIGEGKKKL
jgi:hypothetical protein